MEVERGHQEEAGRHLQKSCRVSLKLPSISITSYAYVLSPRSQQQILAAVFLLAYQYLPRLFVPWKSAANNCRVEAAVGELIGRQMTSNFKGTDQICKMKQNIEYTHGYIIIIEAARRVHRHAVRQSCDELRPACASICGSRMPPSRRGRQPRQEELALPGLPPAVPVPYQAKGKRTTLTKPSNEHLLVRRCCAVAEDRLNQRIERHGWRRRCIPCPQEFVRGPEVLKKGRPPRSRSQPSPSVVPSVHCNCQSSWGSSGPDKPILLREL